MLNKFNKVQKFSEAFNPEMSPRQRGYVAHPSKVVNASYMVETAGIQASEIMKFNVRSSEIKINGMCDQVRSRSCEIK